MEINNVIRIAMEVAGLDRAAVAKKLLGDIMGLPGKEAPGIFKGQQVIDKFNQSLLSQADALKKVGNAHKAYADFQKIIVKSQEQLMQNMQRTSVEALNLTRTITAQRNEIDRLNKAISSGGQAMTSTGLVKRVNVDILTKRQDQLLDLINQENTRKQKWVNRAIKQKQIPSGLGPQELEGAIDVWLSTGATTQKRKHDEISSIRSKLTAYERELRNNAISIGAGGAIPGGGLVQGAIPAEIERLISNVVRMRQGVGAERGIRDTLRKTFQDLRLTLQAETAGAPSEAIYSRETIESLRDVGKRKQLIPLVKQRYLEANRDYLLQAQNENLLALKQNELEQVQTLGHQRQIQAQIDAQGVARRNRLANKLGFADPLARMYGMGPVYSGTMLPQVGKITISGREDIDNLQSMLRAREIAKQSQPDREAVVRKIRIQAQQNRDEYELTQREKEKTERLDNAVREKNRILEQQESRRRNIRAGNIPYESLSRSDRRELRQGQYKEWSSEMGWMIKRHMEWVATGAVMYGVADAFKKAFEEEAKFEKGLARVTSITSKGREQMSVLRKEILNMDKSIFSSAETAETMYHIVSTGLGQTKSGYLDVSSSIKNADNANKLATLGMYDSSEAAVHLAVIMKQFNMGTGESQRVLDGLSYAAAQSATEIPKLAEAMKYAGVVAHQSGLGFEDTLAMMMKLADAGIRGVDMGERLRGILKRLSDPSREAKKAFKEMGIEMVKENGEARSLFERLDMLKKALRGVPSGKREEYLGKIFEQRSIAAGQVLLRYTKEDFQNAINQQKAMNEGQRQFEVMTNNVINQWKMMLNEGSKFGIEVAEPFVKDIAKMTKAGIDFFHTLKSAASNTPGISGAISGGVEATTAIAATLIGSKLGGWGFEKLFGVGANVGDFLKSKHGLYVLPTDVYGPQVRKPGFLSGGIPRAGAGKFAFGMGALGAIGGGAYEGSPGGAAIGGVGMAALSAFGAPMWATIGIPTLAVMSYKYWKDTIRAQEEQLKYQIELKNAAKHALEAASGYLKDNLIDDLIKNIGEKGTKEFLGKVPELIELSMAKMSGMNLTTKGLRGLKPTNIAEFTIGGGYWGSSDDRLRMISGGSYNEFKNPVRQLVLAHLNTRRQKLGEMLVNLQNELPGLEEAEKIRKSGPLGVGLLSLPSFSDVIQDRKNIIERLKSQIDFLDPANQVEIQNETTKAFNEITKLSGEARQDKFKQWVNRLASLMGKTSEYATNLLNDIINSAERMKADREEIVTNLEQKLNGYELVINLLGNDIGLTNKIMLRRKKLDKVLALLRAKNASPLEIGIASSAGMLDIMNLETSYGDKFKAIERMVSEQSLVSIPKDWTTVKQQIDWKNLKYSDISMWDRNYNTPARKYTKQFDNIKKITKTLNEYEMAYREQLEKVESELDKKLSKQLGHEYGMRDFYVKGLVGKAIEKPKSLTLEEVEIVNLQNEKDRIKKQHKEMSEKASVSVVEILHDTMLQLNEDMENARARIDSDLAQLMPSFENQKKAIHDSTQKQLDIIISQQEAAKKAVDSARDVLKGEKDPAKQKKLMDELAKATATYNEMLKEFPAMINDLNLTETIKIFLLNAARIREMNELVARQGANKLRARGQGAAAEYLEASSGLQSKYSQAIWEAKNLEKNFDKAKLLAEEYYYNLTELQNAYKKNQIDDDHELKELRVRNEAEVYKLKGRYADAEYAQRVVQRQKEFQDEMWNARNSPAKQAEIRKFYQLREKQDWREYQATKRAEEAAYAAQSVSARMIAQGRGIESEYVDKSTQLKAEKDKELATLDEKSEQYLKRKEYWQNKELALAKDYTNKLSDLQNEIIMQNSSVMLRLRGSVLIADHYSKMQEIEIRRRKNLDSAGPEHAAKINDTAAKEVEEENRRFQIEYSKDYRSIYLSIMQERGKMTKEEISAEYNMSYQALVDERSMKLRSIKHDNQLAFLIEKEFAAKVYNLWKDTYTKRFNAAMSSMRENMSIFNSMLNSFSSRMGRGALGGQQASWNEYYMEKRRIETDPTMSSFTKGLELARLEETKVGIQSKYKGIVMTRDSGLLARYKQLSSKKIKTKADQIELNKLRMRLQGSRAGNTFNAITTQELNQLGSAEKTLPQLKERSDWLDKTIDELTAEAQSAYEGYDGTPGLKTGGTKWKTDRYNKLLNRINEFKLERDRIKGQIKSTTTDLMKLGTKGGPDVQQRVAQLMSSVSANEQKITVETLNAIIRSSAEVKIDAKEVSFQHPLKIYSDTKIDIEKATIHNKDVERGDYDIDGNYNSKPIEIKIIMDGKEVGKAMISDPYKAARESNKSNGLVIANWTD